MDLYSEVSKNMENLTATFTARMAQYEEDLAKASNDTTAHKSIASLSKDFTEFRGLMWKTMATLKSQLDLLVLGMDRHEMASRFKILLLHGFPENGHTNLIPSVVKMFTERVTVPIGPNDLSTCYFLGTSTNKPRPLLIRFASRKLRNAVWSNKTKLKGTGITLSEFSTKPRHDIFLSARKYYGLRRCWTSEGRIVIQVTEDSRRKIETAAELRDLMIKFPVPLSEGTSNVAPPGPDKRSRKPFK